MKDMKNVEIHEIFFKKQIYCISAHDLKFSKGITFSSAIVTIYIILCAFIF